MARPRNLGMRHKGAGKTGCRDKIVLHVVSRKAGGLENRGKAGHGHEKNMGECGKKKTRARARKRINRER